MSDYAMPGWQNKNMSICKLLDARGRRVEWWEDDVSAMVCMREGERGLEIRFGEAVVVTYTGQNSYLFLFLKDEWLPAYIAYLHKNVVNSLIS